MKKFKTDDLTGIVPLVLNDISFIQDATAEMIEAVVKILSELTSIDSFILSGFVQSGFPSVVSAGWLVLNSKIYKFDGSSFPSIGMGQSVVIRVSENILANGHKIMKPGNTEVDTWYDYKATLISVTNPLSDDVPFSSIKRFQDIINDITAISDDWTPITLNNGEWENDTSVGYAALSYIIKNNVVYLRGHVYKIGSSATICQLPPVIRPKSVIGPNNIISIAINGTVTEYGAQSVIFDGISYLNI